GQGWVVVQREAAQRAADRLDRAAGQWVLKARWAAGGMTGQRLGGEPKRAGVVAVEQEVEGLVRVKENRERLGMEAGRLAAEGGETAAWR
ncbi:hypothetical protein B1218_37950, partial [Pseudomonas ogarae]